MEHLLIEKILSFKLHKSHLNTEDEFILGKFIEKGFAVAANAGCNIYDDNVFSSRLLHLNKNNFDITSTSYFGCLHVEIRT
jgi:hypothetical protein